MNNQFNYELDERHIRLKMQDGELDYSEVLWNKFDKLSVSPSTVSSNFVSFIPQLNLSISRSIIVPVIFIVLIGGLSAMLFSFVDFKKKERIHKEVPYVADIKTVDKPEIQTQVVTKSAPVQIKTEIKKVVLDPKLLKVAAAPVINPPVAVIKNESPVIADVKPDPVVVTTVEEKKDQFVQPKIRKRKVKTEALPTIDATTNVNLNEGASEPELDLK